MKTVLLIMVVGASFSTIQSRLYAVRVPKRTTVSPPLLPPDFRADKFPDLKIPNEKFCLEQALKPADRYLTLPWWYQHCITYMEKKVGNYKTGKYFLPMYRRILDQAIQFKKLKQKLRMP